MEWALHGGRDETEGKGKRARAEFEPPLPMQSVMKVDFGDATDKLMQMAKAAKRVNRARSAKDAAEIGKGGKICGQPGSPKAGDELNMVWSPPKTLWYPCPTMTAPGQAHDKESQGLQAIKVAQVASGRRTK